LKYSLYSSIRQAGFAQIIDKATELADRNG